MKIETYDDAVKECKELLKQAKDIKWKITKISFRWCQSSHGGHVSTKSQYTCQKFAEDIGMPYKQLMRWRREYDLVISKIGKVEKKDIPRRALDETLKRVKKGMDKLEVRKIFNEEKSRVNTDVNLHFSDIARRMSNHKFSICHGYNLKDVDSIHIETILSHAKDIVTAIEYFKSKKVAKVILKQKSALEDIASM